MRDENLPSGSSTFLARFATGPLPLILVFMVMTVGIVLTAIFALSIGSILPVSRGIAFVVLLAAAACFTAGSHLTYRWLRERERSGLR